MIKVLSSYSDLPPEKARPVKIGDASKILGLHIDTLRRWEKRGKITPIRTPGGTRLYSLDELSKLIPNTPDTFSQPSSAKRLPAKNPHRTNEEGIYSHIYNKGVEERIIFNDEEDYTIFRGFLKDYLSAPQDSDSIKKVFKVNGRIFQGTPHQPKNYFNQVELIGYSLMPDHFHLLLHQKTKGSIERFIRSLCTRYSIYFNKKYKRSGSLFQGPYKSIQIEDRVRLLHLTRYLHHVGDNSSYSEYLVLKETSWVKPKVVMSFFEKGTDGYKDFVEKYDQKEKEFLEGITFDSDNAHLVKRNLATNSEKIHLGSNIKPLQRIPEYLAATAIFSLLVAIGITNIQVSKVKGLQSLPAPAVLSIIKSASPSSSPAPTVLSETATNNPAPSQSPLASITGEVNATPAGAIKPKILIIKIDDATDSVNIRQKPTTESDNIGQARNGDIFEFISKDAGWYEIKLADESTGFISATYIVMEETSN